MKTLTVFLTQILACGLLAAPSSAQFIPQATAIPGSAPEGINYQGRLEDGGFPVNGTKTMIFRVHSASVGGVLLWTSPAQAVPVTLGLFSAVVPVPTTVLVGGGARYLEVQIDGTLMAPRELLNSVPYALIAKSVEGNIDVSTAGLAINANSTAVQPALYISSVTGNVGVGTGAPITAFDVGGSAQFGSGATKSTFTAAGALNTAGKITAPDYTATYGLSAATATVSNEILIGGGASVATFGLHLADRNIILSGTGNELRFSGPQAALIGHSGAFDTTLQSDGVVRQIIESGGHTRFVSGISASSGTFRGNGAFHESSADNSVNIFWGAPDGASGWTAGSGVTANDGVWRLYSNDTAATPIAVDDAAGNTITMAASGGLVVTGGNVGIGTTGPSAKLHVSTAGVSGTTNVVQVTTAATAGSDVFVVKGDGRVGIGIAAPTNSLHIYDASGAAGRANALIQASAENAYLNMQADAWTANPSATLVKQGSTGLLKLNNAGSSSLDHLVVDDQGKVGVGAVPAARLHVSSTNAMAADTVLLVSSGTAAGQELLIVKGDGKVGIGTTNPGAALDVKSQINLTNSSSISIPGLKGTEFGYSSSYRVLQVGATSGNTTVGIGYDPSANAGSSFTGDGREVLFRNGTAFTTPNAANNEYHLNLVVLKDGKVGIGTAGPAVELDVKDQGEFGLGAFTQAQVNAKTPGKVGTLILNSSINQVCVSTGTTIMGYAKIRDGSTCQ